MQTDSASMPRLISVSTVGVASIGGLKSAAEMAATAVMRRAPTTSPLFMDALGLLLACSGQKIDQVGLPDGGLGMSAVAPGGIRDGNQNEFGIGHLRDHLLRDAELRGIDEIIGGIDPQHRCGDGC